jgi:hypothetical protein
MTELHDELVLNVRTPPGDRLNDHSMRSMKTYRKDLESNFFKKKLFII